MVGPRYFYFLKAFQVGPRYLYFLTRIKNYFHNRRRNKNHMIISDRCRKSIWQNLTSFMMWTLKLGIEGNVFKINKAICEKSSANITLNDFSSKIMNKARLLTLATSVQKCTESLRSVRQQKEIKGIQKRKEDVKWSLFADDMIL